MATLAEALTRELATLFEADHVALDADGCCTLTLPWGGPVHFRWSEASRNLLAAAPVGELAAGDLPVRCLTLLAVNHQPGLLAGGALGLDFGDNTVWLSRGFVLPAEPAKVADALGSLPALLETTQVAAQLVAVTNQITFNDEANAYTVEELLPADAEQLVQELDEPDEQAAAEAAWAADQGLQQEIATFHTLAKEALAAMGLAGAEPDDEGAYYLADEGQPVEAQLRFDEAFGEIALTALLPPTPGGVSDTAAALLGLNLMLRQTGGCVLGVDDESDELSLSLRAPVAAFEGDAAGLRNLVVNFWNNALGFAQNTQRQGQSSSGAAGPPAEAPLLPV